MFIRDTVTAKEHLYGLQSESTKSALLNEKKVRLKNKTYKKYANNTKLFSQNKGKSAVDITTICFRARECFTKI